LAKQEYFEIQRYGRRYDRRTNCFILNIAYQIGFEVQRRRHLPVSASPIPPFFIEIL
jgi:hypothetical protein